jgi:phosphopantothenoylcysteine decarboxylase/phosphopantothenate--cysteine ligase
MLATKSILLAVSGGIAAYKCVELARQFVKQGATVRVVMTKAATAFVGPVSFEGVTGVPVCQDLFDQQDAVMGHIEWAQNVDLMVVAPATANVIGKMAAGIADDAVTTMALATTAPVLVCPTMNVEMYQKPVVQANIKRLVELGLIVMEPAVGEQACGAVGPGRLPEPAAIFEKALGCILTQDLAGRRILVTAGPTHEAIDPVRFIGNPSSGKMGYSVARAAAQRGARVTLVSGPTHLESPADVRTIRVVTALEMAKAVESHFNESDVVIKTAAVSDYRPVSTADQKIKKTASTLDLHLVQNPDILKILGKMKKDQVLVGFAAETENITANAQKKMEQKNLDLIVANDVSRDDAGFATDTNTVSIFSRTEPPDKLPSMSKEKVAHHLLDRVVHLLPNLP